ncbi:Hypothetical protein, putative [Bodo saltans]|uniref:Uncharacterized protein n=1 Tax=Bodo saltans TaxID=75058 RepID=A0A0S4IQ24_BODSA|nr:Hypothetical protein, putative [Bodo saltans]|eukprot:CUF92087.1 Hypothetical protein, putative [Bodo saltans]
MRVLSETLGVSNVHVEAKDAIGTSGVVVSPSVDPLQAALDDDGGDESESEQADPEFASKAQSQSEKERIFGRLAPLVLDAPSQLPDALTILKDWGNNCLDDLQSLDGVGGASLSSRFSSLTTELRDGIIISRLLFYLALPRYRPPSGRNDELEDVNPDFNVNRMRLLKQRGVQLHSPFPTYDDCFGDLMRYPPVKRMSILLNFASDLISATHRLTPDQLEALETLQMLADRSKSESVDETPVSNSPRLSLAGDGLLGAKRSSSPQLKRKTSSKVLLKWMEGVPKSQRRGSTAFGSDDATFPSSSEFLPQYVDPILLCEGSKAASVTLLAMLYVRFAHAFNHKAQETAAKEVELMRALLRDQESSSGGGGGGGISSPTRGRGSVAQPSKLDTMLSAIDEEEKSPWNIFLDRCKPFFTSSAHGFVLEGNFWSAMTCESAEMLEVFSAVTCAMQRSLETHRWHITMQCLTPLISSIGMTRGCFSGMLASTDYYLYQRSCEAQDIVFMPEVVYLLATQRKEILPPNEQGGVGSSSASTRQLSELPTSPPCENIIVAPMVPNHDTFIELEDSTNTSGCDPDEFRKHPYYQRLQDVLHAFTDDLARVFLSRASTNSTMLAPIVTLASWRMLWMDAGLCPGKISLEAITFMFSDACQSQHQTRQHLGGGGNAHRGSGDDSTTSSDHGGGITIASLQEMSFDAFYDGCLRVANYRYAPVTLGASGGGGGNGASIGPSHISSPGMSALESSHYNHHPPPLSGFHSVSPSASRATSASTGKKKVYTSLQEAFTKLLVDVIVPLHPIHSPPVAIQHLKQGVLVQDLLRRRNAELLAVFQAYAKVHLGITAVEKDDALRMIKDAGLATAELSYQVVADLFVECSVKRTLADQSAMNAMDPWHVDAPYGGGGHSGSIFQNTANSNNNSAAPPAGGMAALQALAAQQQRSSASRNHQSLMQQTTVDRQLLDFTAFVDFICVLMLYKLPNPFQPMHTKLEYFLDRNVIAPLRFRVDQAAKARARRRDTNVGAPNAGTGKFLNLLESVQQQSL